MSDQAFTKRPSPAVKGCAGCSSLLVLIFGIILLKAYWSDSSRNSELASTTDPSRIAFLHLDYRAQDAKSSAKKIGDHVTIEFSIDPWALTGSTARSQFLNFSGQLFQDCFARISDAQTVTIVGTGPFSDVKGNDSRGRAFEIEFTREAASSVNWDKVRTDNLPTIATSYWQHPSFEK